MTNLELVLMFRAWISNYTHLKYWDVITHPGPKLKYDMHEYLLDWKLMDPAQDVRTQHTYPTTIRASINLQTYLKDRLSQVSVQ